MFGALGGQLVAQVGVGPDEVDQAAVLGSGGAGEAQGARLSDADRASGLRTSGHTLLLGSSSRWSGGADLLQEQLEGNRVGELVLDRTASCRRPAAGVLARSSAESSPVARAIRVSNPLLLPKSSVAANTPVGTTTACR